MRARVLLLTSLALATTSVSPVRADGEPDDETKEKARALVAEASSAFEAHDYLKCATSFRQAYELVPIPHIRFNLGVCLERLARFREAAVEFEAASTSEVLTADVRARASERFAAVKMRLGLAKLGPVADFETAVIDGDIECTLPCAVHLDPGRHEASVGTGDRRRVTRFSIVAGAEVEVTFAPPVATPTPRTDDDARIGWMTWTGGSMAAVGVAGTVGFGLRTLSLKDTFDTDPTQATADSGNRMRNLTNLSLTVAATGAALVLIDLLWTR